MPLTSRDKEVISGLTAGLTTTVINHPLDVIKVRLQLDNSRHVTQWQAFKSVVQGLYCSDTGKGSLRRLVQNSYRGIMINLVGNSISWSMYFTLYNDLKKVKLAPNEHQNYLASSFLSGSITTLITNPIWLLKTRYLSTNKDVSFAYKSLSSAIKRIINEEGFRTFFNGFVPALMSVSQGALYFTIYDSLKQHKFNVGKLKKSDKLDFSTYLQITGISKIVSTAIFYPLQIFRSRLQSYSTQRNKILQNGQSTKGSQFQLIALAKGIMAKEGFRGFYKGLYINLFRTLPATCVTFLTYEHVKHFLNNY